MPLNQAPSVLMPPDLFAEQAPSPRWRVGPLLLCAVAGGLFVLLAVMGQARPEAATLAALAMLAIGAVVGLRSTARREDALGRAAGLASAAEREEAYTYALALELAPNPVLIVTAQEADDVAGRRVLFANAEAREVLRIPREGALLVAALRNPAVLEAIDEALFGRTPRVISYEAGGGSDRFWRLWTKPLPPTAAQPRQALVILRDETDVRLNERMRADFLANASHELRTPLASLTGFIETLRGHARDDVGARDRFLAIMARQSERMARLIDDLLSLSRIELNEHIRPDGVCDLSLAIGDVVDALSPQVAAKSVRVVQDLPPASRTQVFGERDQLVQVIQNLIDNAVKYSADGGVVRVSVTPDLSLEAASALKAGDPRLAAPDGGRMALVTPVRSRSERFVLLCVEDAGAGMAREHLPRLTERFYRVEGQKSGERMGTGLGLAIVKHIVVRHRGGFFVESAPGLGALFCIYLPMAAAAAPQASQSMTKLS